MALPMSTSMSYEDYLVATQGAKKGPNGRVQEKPNKIKPPQGGQQ